MIMPRIEGKKCLGIGWGKLWWEGKLQKEHLNTKPGKARNLGITPDKLFPLPCKYLPLISALYPFLYPSLSYMEYWAFWLKMGWLIWYSHIQAYHPQNHHPDYLKPQSLAPSSPCLKCCKGFLLAIGYLSWWFSVFWLLCTFCQL